MEMVAGSAAVGGELTGATQGQSGFLMEPHSISNERSAEQSEILKSAGASSSEQSTRLRRDFRESFLFETEFAECVPISAFVFSPI